MTGGGNRVREMTRIFSKGPEENRCDNRKNEVLAFFARFRLKSGTESETQPPASARGGFFMSASNQTASVSARRSFAFQE